MVARIVVLISGSGTNLQALIDNVASFPAEIVHVISSSATAYGLTRASNANIPTSVHSLKTYYTDIPKEDKSKRQIARNKFDSDLASKIEQLKPDIVVCAGWMLILSPSFLQPMSKICDVINLHPALPGCFAGTHAIERSWEAGQKGEITNGGCMVHYVIEEVDGGKPIIVETVDVRKEESCDDWEARIHAKEHKAIVAGTKVVLKRQGKL